MHSTMRQGRVHGNLAVGTYNKEEIILLPYSLLRRGVDAMAESADDLLLDYVDMFPRTSAAGDIQTDVSSHVETVLVMRRA